MTNLHFDTAAIEPARWRLITVLLSMDVVAPFHEAMGLRLRDKAGFVALLRDFLRDELGPTPAGAGSADGAADRLFARLTARAGAEEARRLFDWATLVQAWTHQDQPHWSGWSIVLLHWAYGSGGLDLPPARLDPLLDGFRMVVKGTEALGHELAAADGRPRSDWDAALHDRFRLDADPESGDRLSLPLGIVLFSAEIHRLQRLWAERRGDGWTAAELARLRDGGQHLLGRLEVWMPGPLLPLDALPRLT